MHRLINLGDGVLGQDHDFRTGLKSHINHASGFGIDGLDVRSDAIVVGTVALQVIIQVR